jgi:hypothetical protein
MIRWSIRERSRVALMKVRRRIIVLPSHRRARRLDHGVKARGAAAKVASWSDGVVDTGGAALELALGWRARSRLVRDGARGRIRRARCARCARCARARRTKNLSSRHDGRPLR